LSEDPKKSGGGAAGIYVDPRHFQRAKGGRGRRGGGHALAGGGGDGGGGEVGGKGGGGRERGEREGERETGTQPLPVKEVRREKKRAEVLAGAEGKRESAHKGGGGGGGGEVKREDADAEGTRENKRPTQTLTPEEEVDVKREAAEVEVKRESGQTDHVPVPKEAHGGGRGGHAQSTYDALDWQRAYEEAERLQDQERAFGVSVPSSLLALPVIYKYKVQILKLTRGA
jgi:hypothetical protein